MRSNRAEALGRPSRRHEVLDMPRMAMSTIFLLGSSKTELESSFGAVPDFPTALQVRAVGQPPGWIPAPILGPPLPASPPTLQHAVTNRTLELTLSQAQPFTNGSSVNSKLYNRVSGNKIRIGVGKKRGYLMSHLNEMARNSIT
jgi:hypothetical protein